MNINLDEINSSQLVARYKKFRKIIFELQNEDLTKYVTKKALNVCGSKLGILHNNTFVLDDPDQIAVVMDYCIYDYSEGGLNAIARYKADYPSDPDSEKYTVLKAMSESFYTIVQVENVLPGIGVKIKDLMGDKQFLLIDMSLSRTADVGIAIATRLLIFEDFVTTSGAALPVDVETFTEIMDYADQNYGAADGEYIEVDTRQRADLIAAIIRMCMEANASEYVRYEDAETQPVTSPLHRETRIGRNEPCPCGSGKKFKQCCGQESKIS